MKQAARVHVQNQKREREDKPLTGELKRETTRIAEEMVKFVTGKNTLEEALAALKWSGPTGNFTSEEVVSLLFKWGIPQRDATEFARDFDWEIMLQLTV